MLDRIKAFFGLSRALKVPDGYELRDGVLIASSNGSKAPRRGTRELMVAYRESPRLRAVLARIARGVADVQARAYTRTREEGKRSTLGPRRDAQGVFRDVAVAPVFDWGSDRGVRDLLLAFGASRLRARRRRELGAAGLLREVPDHPILDLLVEPNPVMSGRFMMFVTQLWLDLKGEAFWLVAKATDGQPIGLWPVPPHWVKSVPSSTSPHFEVSPGGLTMKLDPSAVIWLREPDPEQPYGRGSGVGESLSDEIETDEYAAKYLKNWFFNNAMPSAIVAFEDAKDASQLKLLKEAWEREHRGTTNAHRVHFAGGKMNAQRLDASLKDQMIVQLREFSRDAVAQVFAVPPEMVGIIENSNRSTIDAAGYIYAVGVELPRAEFLRSELQRQLAPMFDAALVLELEVPIPDDETRRLNVMKALPGGFSVNEWRAEANYESLPRFDDVFPPMALPGQDPGGDPEKPAPDPDEPAVDDPEDEGEKKTRELPADPPWAKRLLDIDEVAVR